MFDSQINQSLTNLVPREKRGPGNKDDKIKKRQQQQSRLEKRNSYFISVNFLSIKMKFSKR